MAGILEGRPSVESPESIKKWLAGRERAGKKAVKRSVLTRRTTLFQTE